MPPPTAKQLCSPWWWEAEVDKQSDTLHPQLSRPLGREQAKVLEMVVTAPPETHTLSSRGCCFPKTVPVRRKGQDLKNSENQPLRGENRNKDNHLLSPLEVETKASHTYSDVQRVPSANTIPTYCFMPVDQPTQSCFLYLWAHKSLILQNEWIYQNLSWVQDFSGVWTLLWCLSWLKLIHGSLLLLG